MREPNLLSYKSILKKICVTLSILILVIIALVVTHLSPTLALKTHLAVRYFSPKVALTSTFQYSDEWLSDSYKVELKHENAKIYSLTKPFSIFLSGGEVKYFIVHKKGFLYIADDICFG